MRAATNLYDVGVAGNQTDILNRNAEPFIDQLREARLVTLAVRYGADHQIEASVRVHGQLGPLSWNARCRIDVIGDADAAIATATSRLGLAHGKFLPIG